MKNLLKLSMFLMLISLSLNSCRDQNTKDSEAEQMMNEDGAEIKVKDNKVKVKTDDKKLKIKEKKDGTVKKKVKETTDDN